MANFKYGLLSGTGNGIEYQIWCSGNEHAVSLNTRRVNDIVGDDNHCDFRYAPFYSSQHVGDLGFTICGYNEEQITKLAKLFIDFLSSISDEFHKVPPTIIKR